MRKSEVKLQNMVGSHPEEKLEKNEKRHCLFAESMSDVIWTMDLDLNFTYVSPSVTHMLGYSLEEVMAQTLEDILSFDSFETVIRFIEELKHNQIVRKRQHSNLETLELELTCKDGSTVWTETKISFLYDAYGMPREVLGVTRDITVARKTGQRMRRYAKELAQRDRELKQRIRKAKKAEEKIREHSEQSRIVNLQRKAQTKKAQEADRRKSEFLANMSHEIRTPLTVIDGAIRLLHQSSLSPEQRDLCTMIRGSSEQLTEILDAILDLARIEARQVKVVEKEFPLKETVKNIISGFEFEARKKNLEIEMICSSHLPSKIRTDEGKLSQILSNLIANALKFTEKGKIEVRLNNESNSRIRFSVEDTGVGIAEEKLSRIFSKFYQTDGTVRREQGGAGLGLTIVKELVDLLGGKIKVKSKLGKGSLFCFSLPCMPAKEKLVPHRDRNGTPFKTKEAARKGINILIAEDDSSTYYIIRKFLKGYTISRAVDGKDVLKRIKEKSYDLVLMDIQMPEMDGLEATRKIREKNLDLPIIAVTAQAFKADEKKCLAAGCNDYIPKPIVPEKLIAKIKQYTVKRISRRQNSPQR